MDCPRCRGSMQEHALAGHGGRPVVIDICLPCQSIWFDTLESPALSPASTLALFRLIGEQATRPVGATTAPLTCPRCRMRLRATRDMQRATRFEYLRCPRNHGRLTTFLEFLKEKDFIRPLTTEQIEELRRNVRAVSCANCGAPVDLAVRSSCTHCGSPLSMLDLGQAEQLIAQLQRADSRTHQPIDPALPLNLARARRETEASFAGLVRDGDFLRNLSEGSLVFAGVRAIARWLSPGEDTSPTTNH